MNSYEDIFSDKQPKLEEMTEEAIGVASTVGSSGSVAKTSLASLTVEATPIAFFVTSSSLACLSEKISS